MLRVVYHEDMLEKFVGPLLGKLDAEAEHVAIREFLHALEHSADPDALLQILRGGERFSDPRLAVNVAGIRLDNPLIVGPGFDKIGVAEHALFELGFGAIEVGSVMTRPQAGNPRPRHITLAPGVPLNRYGFNGPGVEVVAQNLATYDGSGLPLGINIGRNKDVTDDNAPQEAYVPVVRRLCRQARYFVINVSSPNTPGHRALQAKGPLAAIVRASQDALKDEGVEVPLFVKIAPDMTMEAVDDVIEVVLESGIAGIVATNTTVNADIKAKYGIREEMGGVSGDDADFRKMSTDIIKRIYKQAGKKLTILGAGGVKDAATALEKIRAGASAVQIVAALDEEGPTLPGRINRDLVAYMEKEGIKNISDLVGVDAA